MRFIFGGSENCRSARFKTEGQVRGALLTEAARQSYDRYGRQAEYHVVLRAAASLQKAAVHGDEDRAALLSRAPAYSFRNALSAG
jgi:hypothetical protein